MLNVLEERSLNKIFWKDMMSEKISITDCQHRDVVAIMVTKAEFLVTKDQ